MNGVYIAISIVNGIILGIQLSIYRNIRKVQKNLDAHIIEHVWHNLIPWEDKEDDG